MKCHIAIHCEVCEEFEPDIEHRPLDGVYELTLVRDSDSPITMHLTRGQVYALYKLLNTVTRDWR